jgi:uncharacterized membrane protein YedE/YeeE
MKRIVSAGLIGLLFGTGIAVSGMIDPAKVLNFFDFAGTWDASLALVMAGALLVTAPGYRLVLRRRAPLFDRRYHIPAARRIDPPLLLGAAVFGIGWGITGFCPGGAIPALGLAQPAAFAFVAAMVAGIVAARMARSRLAGAVNA